MLSRVPPFEFSIDSGLTYQTSSSANIAFNNLSAGRYYISVRDSNGCESDNDMDLIGEMVLSQMLFLHQ